MSTPQNTDKLLISRSGVSYSITYQDLNADAAQALTDAASAQTTADAALPKAGGTMTGALTSTAGASFTGNVTTGSRLGVGITSPTYDVCIEGSSPILDIYNTDATSDDSHSVTIQAYGPSSTYRNKMVLDASSIDLQTQGVTKWSIDSAGELSGGGEITAGARITSQAPAGNDRKFTFYDANGVERGRIVNSATNNYTFIQNMTNANTVAATAFLDSSDGSWEALYFRTTGSSGRMRMTTGNLVDFHWSAGFYYRIDLNAYVLINSSPSDAKMKDVKGGIDNASDIILSLKPTRYSFKDGLPIEVDKRERYGFVAQELQEVLPEAVETKGLPPQGDEEIGKSGDDEYLALATDFDAQMIAVLTKSLQEALVRIDALEDEVKQLKG